MGWIRLALLLWFLLTTTHPIFGWCGAQVFTPPGRGESGRFALDVAVRTLELYDDFFRVPYPLPKLDMIAIMDFAMGAMENWGAW